MDSCPRTKCYNSTLCEKYTGITEHSHITAFLQLTWHSARMTVSLSRKEVLSRVTFLMGARAVL